MKVTLAALNVYPVKSCRGIAVEHATLTATGLAHDREWMIVTPGGRFVTQREESRLALIGTALDPSGLRLSIPGAEELFLPFTHEGTPAAVTIWKDECRAFDAGEAAAKRLTDFLGKPHRLVRFDPLCARQSDPTWTGATTAFNRFSDGFPLLAVSEASLADLNTRLPDPLPMNRFRPNLVLAGLAPYEEDALEELAGHGFRLRAVKPCTRCKITTINQETGNATGTQPVSTLATYRMSRNPQGVLFGQNMIPLEGIDRRLEVGQVFTPAWRPREGS